MHHNNVKLKALAEGEFIFLKADLITKVLLAMSYEHHKAHDGGLYTFFFNKAIGAGATAEIWCKTKATRKVPHLVLEIDASAGSLVEIIRGSTKTYVGGNALVEANHNDNYPDDGEFAQVCHTPAGTENSTAVRDQYRVGGFKAPGTRASGSERVCRGETAYLIRVTADDNGTDVNIKGTYYAKEDLVMPHFTTSTTTTTTTTTT
jgi:hypothetical protein